MTVLRSENSNFNLANFMRTHIYSAIATLKIGMEILEEENVDIDKLMGTIMAVCLKQNM